MQQKRGKLLCNPPPAYLVVRLGADPEARHKGSSGPRNKFHSPLRVVLTDSASLIHMFSCYKHSYSAYSPLLLFLCLSLLGFDPGLTLPRISVW